LKNNFYGKSPNEAYLDNVDGSLNPIYEHGILFGVVCVVLIKRKNEFLDIFWPFFQFLKFKIISYEKIKKSIFMGVNREYETNT
jgi:hypothetical protein